MVGEFNLDVAFVVLMFLGQVSPKGPPPWLNPIYNLKG